MGLLSEDRTAGLCCVAVNEDIVLWVWQGNEDVDVGGSDLFQRFLANGMNPACNQCKWRDSAWPVRDGAAWPQRCEISANPS